MLGIINLFSTLTAGDTPKSNPALVAIIIIAIVIFVGAIIFYEYRRIKRKRAKKDDPSKPKAPTKTPGSEELA